MAAITGLPSRRRVGPIGPSPSSSTRLLRSVPRPLRSAPAQKVPPSPYSTATLAPSSASNARNASASDCAVGPSTALRACGRCRTTVVTGPSCSMRTSTMVRTLDTRGVPGPDSDRKCPKGRVRGGLHCSKLVGMTSRSRGLRETVVRALAKVGLVWSLAVLGALFMAMSAQGQDHDRRLLPRFGRDALALTLSRVLGRDRRRPAYRWPGPGPGRPGRRRQRPRGRRGPRRARPRPAQPARAGAGAGSPSRPGTGPAGLITSG